MYFNDFLHKEINNTQIALEINTILQSHPKNITQEVAK
jgi:hypothetical protein